MNDTVLIQQCYPGYGYEPMLELTRERNAAYCQRWGYDYQCVIDPVLPHPAIDGAWAKIELIRRAMESYKNIVWLDADAMIADLDTDLRDAVQHNHIGACWHRIPQLHHWNVGVLYVSSTEETRAFIREWLAAYPAPPDGWNEQGVFNRLAMKSKTVVTVSDRWNATLNTNMVPDAAVLGFHGAGNASERYKLMQETLAKL